MPVLMVRLVEGAPIGWEWGLAGAFCSGGIASVCAAAVRVRAKMAAARIVGRFME